MRSHRSSAGTPVRHLADKNSAAALRAAGAGGIRSVKSAGGQLDEAPFVKYGDRVQLAATSAYDGVGPVLVGSLRGRVQRAPLLDDRRAARRQLLVPNPDLPFR